MILLYHLGYGLLFRLKRLRKRHRIFDKPARTYEYYFSLLLNRKIRPWMESHPTKRGLNTRTRPEKYIVSLTSFPTRINHVHIPIETLLRQSFKPDAIILWLAESQFPGKVLPQRLLDLQQRGVTIGWCDDLRSHKKYFYSFMDYPDANIILADDDLFYPRDTLYRLAKLHKKHPSDICAMSAQIIGPEISSPPSVWPAQQVGKRYISSMEAQAFTGAGSLFPPGWCPEEIFDKEKAMAMAGTADDLWLKAMSLVAQVPTTVENPVRGFPIEVQIENNTTLFQQNKASGENRNDLTWSALVKEFGLEP